MRQLSRALRANCFSSLREPFFYTPPCLVYRARSFTTTPPHHRYQVPQRKQKTVEMAHDMTTLKGKPFDRTSLESLMKVFTFPALVVDQSY